MMEREGEKAPEFGIEILGHIRFSLLDLEGAFYAILFYPLNRCLSILDLYITKHSIIQKFFIRVAVINDHGVEIKNAGFIF